MTIQKVVVFGYDELLPASLDFFSRKQTSIAAVVFPSNRKDWRADKIRQIVAEKGFQTLEQPPRKNSREFTRTMRQIEPDLIFVWSYPMILPEEIIQIPRYGAINVHFGLLPEYRGVNGVRWALLNGEEKTGVTIHYMDSGIDSGDIISRVSFPIATEDDMLSLLIKSKTAGLYLLENCWREIASGKVQTIPQDESKANYYSARESAIDSIDWSKSNLEIHNLIRASVKPFPGVYTLWNTHKLVIRKSVPIENAVGSGIAGTVEKIDSGGIEVAAGNGNLLVTEIELEGKPIPLTKLADLELEVGSKFKNRQ